MHENEIKIENMAKVYGHAGLDIKLRGSKVKSAQLNLTESSRFFESMIVGRRFDQVSSIASRICGICSPSHNITSLMAVENAFGIEPSEQTKRLRELFIYGGWIQSHALHSYFLALPDYMGCSSVLDMAKDNKKDVERALRLKKLGNEIALCIGGRDVHASTTAINGFSRCPTKEELNDLLALLKKGRVDAMKTVKLFSSIRKPRFSRKRVFIALKKKGEYAILDGKVRHKDKYLNPKGHRKTLKLENRSYSTSKFIKIQGREFMVGPLARVSINRKNLSKGAKHAMRSMKLKLPSYSPFDSNLARIVELVHCIERATELIKNIRPKQEINRFNFSKLKKSFYDGYAITEAPRGILYHNYRINRNGIITNADIITPTANNLLVIENDIINFLPQIIKRPRNSIILELEKLVRSYDPCISCSTHFLEVNFL